MRSPNQYDIRCLLKEGESRGFPRMLESIDSMHWKWKKLSSCLERYVCWPCA